LGDAAFTITWKITATKTIGKLGTRAKHFVIDVSPISRMAGKIGNGIKKSASAVSGLPVTDDSIVFNP
jgi:hypothetical protein